MEVEVFSLLVIFIFVFILEADTIPVPASASHCLHDLPKPLLPSGVCVCIILFFQGLFSLRCSGHLISVLFYVVLKISASSLTSPFLILSVIVHPSLTSRTLCHSVLLCVPAHYSSIVTAVVLVCFLRSFF
jgi:hypothetical protein